MTINNSSKVSIEYTLTLGDDEVVDSNKGGEPLAFVQGSGQIIPGLDKELLGLAVGDSKKVTVVPEEGYGVVVPEAIIELKKEQLPPEALEAGAQVQGQGQGGEPIYGRVMDVKEETAVVDFNHPLAGKTLYFDVKVLSVE